MSCRSCMPYSLVPSLGQDRGAVRKRLAVLAHGLVQERQRPIGLSAQEDTGVPAEGRAQVVEIGKIVVTRGVEDETGGPDISDRIAVDVVQAREFPFPALLQPVLRQTPDQPAFLRRKNRIHGTRPQEPHHVVPVLHALQPRPINCQTGSPIRAPFPSPPRGVRRDTGGRFKSPGRRVGQSDKEYPAESLTGVQ